jgi:lipopolysaccharide export system permease protein
VHISTTFSFYLGRQFLFWFAAVFFVLLALIFVFDVLELLRRMSSRPQSGIGLAIEMGLLRASEMARRIVPFAVLFGALLGFWRLNRNHEFVVARAAGVSAWQFLMPAIVAAILIGAFKMAVFSPFAATLFLRYEQMEARYLEGRASLLAVSPTGLWLRQAGADGRAIVHAKRLAARTMEFSEVTIYRFSATDRFSGRIDAPRARLEDGYWLLRDAQVTSAEGVPRTVETYRFATNLTPNTIHDSFARPETMSFWSLPAFINQLEDAGFSGLRHRLFWHAQLADPLLLFAMVLIAATFSLRPARRGRTGVVLVAGIATGFLVYVVSDIVFALGLSARIPVVLAAWTPATVTTLLGLAMLFHLEDG